VAYVRSNALAKLLSDDPMFWRYLGQLLCHKLEVAFEMLESTAAKQPKVRLAQLLVALSTGYRQRNDGARLRLHVSQERLATVLSCSRQTVNALLGAFEEEGVIRVSRGAIQIVDLNQLRSHVE
jgi:CRP/FNR family transcriptional regulator, cyclic AMP receptor protein